VGWLEEFGSRLLVAASTLAKSCGPQVRRPTPVRASQLERPAGIRSSDQKSFIAHSNQQTNRPDRVV